MNGEVTEPPKSDIKDLSYEIISENELLKKIRIAYLSIEFTRRE